MHVYVVGVGGGGGDYAQARDLGERDRGQGEAIQGLCLTGWRSYI